MPPKPSNPDSISDPKRHFLHSIVSPGGGGVLTYTLGVGVPPKTSNPDPISDPKRHFLHFIVSPRGEGGGGYLPTLGCGSAAQAFKS